MIILCIGLYYLLRYNLSFCYRSNNLTQLQLITFILFLITFVLFLSISNRWLESNFLKIIVKLISTVMLYTYFQICISRTELYIFYDKFTNCFIKIFRGQYKKKMGRMNFNVFLNQILRHQVLNSKDLILYCVI